ncbi:MFS transporter [Kitasatospora cinereorecta]
MSVTLGIAALVYGLAEGQHYGWGSARIVTSLTAGVLLLAVFVLDQAKLAEQPLMELSLFRNRSVWAANLTMLAFGAALPTMFYFLTLLYQTVLHYSAIRTGLAFLPLTVFAFIGAAASSGVAPRTGPRPMMLAGLLPMIAGLVWQSAADENASYLADLLGPTLLFGLGLGIVVTSVAGAATAGVPQDKHGLASGVLNTSQSLGGAAGLAVMVALAQTRTADVAGDTAPDAHAFVSGYGVAFLATGYCSPSASRPRRRCRAGPGSRAGPVARGQGEARPVRRAGFSLPACRARRHRACPERFPNQGAGEGGHRSRPRHTCQDGGAGLIGTGPTGGHTDSHTHTRAGGRAGGGRVRRGPVGRSGAAR